MTDDGNEYGDVRRREWLALAGGSLALAGCLGGDDDEDDTRPNSTDGSPATTDDSTDGTDPDDDATDTGPDDTSDSPDDDPDDGSENGTDNTPPPAALSDLRVADVPEATTLGVGDDELVSVTVTSQATDSHEFALDLAVYNAADIPDTAETTDSETGNSDGNPVPDGVEPVTTTSRDVPLDPEASTRATFAGVTDSLADGSYTVVTSAGGDHATIGLTVLGTTELTVEVYTQESTLRYRATQGELVVTATDTGTEHARAPLAGDGHPTVEFPLAETTDYTLSVDNPGDQYGTYPPASTNISVTDSDTDELEFVTAYPLNSAASFRFEMYFYNERGTGDSAPTESHQYGTYGPAGAYHIYYTIGSAIPTRSKDPGDSPPEYGADLQAIRQENGGGVPSHSLQTGNNSDALAEYFYPGADGWWELSPEGEPVDFGRVSHNAAIRGLEGLSEWLDTTFTYDETETIDGTIADVYELDAQDRNTTVFVNPETGHVIRYVRVGFGERYPTSFEIVEMNDHGTVDSIDWELIKERSHSDTGPDTDTLPWELRET